MITVRFACDHSMVISDGANTVPRCVVCGETRVSHVRTSRPPRFVGTCTGPHATFNQLDPGIVNVAPAGPLVLKAQE